MAARTIDELIAEAIAAASTERNEGAVLALARTERRDVLTATARQAENKSLGRHYRTEFRLNGERISQRAAELLAAAYA